MANDHDLLLHTSQQSDCDHNWIEKAEPRLRTIEDTLLQAKTTLTIARATFGMVSIGIVVQVAIALHLI